MWSRSQTTALAVLVVLVRRRHRGTGASLSSSTGSRSAFDGIPSSRDELGDLLLSLSLSLALGLALLLNLTLALVLALALRILVWIPNYEHRPTKPTKPHRRRTWWSRRAMSENLAVRSGEKETGRLCCFEGVFLRVVFFQNRRKTRGCSLSIPMNRSTSLCSSGVLAGLNISAKYTIKKSRNKPEPVEPHP